MYPIHLAIAKYGEDNFEFKILEWTDDFNNKEKEYIKTLNTICPNGYNIAEGGSNMIMFGEDHPRNTLPDIIVTKIIEELKDGKLSDRELAKKYETTDKIIADINHGYSHHKDEIQYPIRKKLGLQKISEEQLFEIRKYLKDTCLSYQEIANLYGVSKGAIYHINKGLTFFDNKIDYPIRKEPNG